MESASYHFGASLGRAWRRLLQGQAHAVAWLSRRGFPRIAAQGFLWALTLAILALIIYVSFWIVLLIFFAALAAQLFRHADQGSEETKWFPKPSDHRSELFYHPLSYNDDPDPRFDDPRFKDH